MLEVEGGTRDELPARSCATSAATRSSTPIGCSCGRRWRRHFGSPRQQLPRRTTGRIRPAAGSCSTCASTTRRAIPVEDFAETFAVWLQPRAVWRKRYAGWPALRKLEYVDELMAEIAERRRRRCAPAASVESLPRARHDAARVLRRRSASSTRSSIPTSTTATCGGCSRTTPRTGGRERASRLPAPQPRRDPAAGLALDRRVPVHLDQVLADMIGRCRELKLRAVGSGAPAADGRRGAC